MKTVLHTKEQGLRVHGLATLGGLVAIAGLETIDPPLLLGALLELAAELAYLDLQHIARLRKQGLQKLSERKKEKKEKHVHREETPGALLPKDVTLKLDEIKTLIMRLGGKVPVLEKDIIPELYRLMR